MDDDAPNNLKGAIVIYAIMAAIFALFCATVLYGVPASGADPIDPLTRWGTPEGTVMVDVPGHLCGAYDGRSRCPRWKLEYLTPRTIHGPAVRRKVFREDDRIPIEFRATLASYQHANGFDRGHDAPFADLLYSQKAADETFLLSNMTPQDSALNEVLWCDLETHVRSLVTPNSQVWVLTFPIFASDDQFLRIQIVGVDRIWVPTQYGKVVLVLHEDEELPTRLYSWIVPNATPEVGKTIDDFVSTVDEAEVVAGLDAFALLPRDLQIKLEAQK